MIVPRTTHSRIKCILIWNATQKMHAKICQMEWRAAAATNNENNTYHNQLLNGWKWIRASFTMYANGNGWCESKLHVNDDCSSPINLTLIALPTSYRNTRWYRADCSVWSSKYSWVFSAERLFHLIFSRSQPISFGDFLVISSNTLIDLSHLSFSQTDVELGEFDPNDLKCSFYYMQTFKSNHVSWLSQSYWLKSFDCSRTSVSYCAAYQLVKSD